MLFIDNKYTQWYLQIVKKGKARTILNEYSEKHHIIPKSLGGPDTKINLVRLTAREHFLCHWLLTKMVEPALLKKMEHAFWRMLVKGGDHQHRYRTNSRTYESLRLKYGSLRKGTKQSEESKRKVSNANIGKIPWNKGIPRTVEEKNLISQKRKETAKKVGVWNQGKRHSHETLLKITERAKMRIKHVCPHCAKETTGSNYYRWHGDNCRAKKL